MTYDLIQLWRSAERVGIHCSTYQEAIRICNGLHKLGYTWGGGASYLDNAHGYEEYGSSYTILNSNMYTTCCSFAGKLIESTNVVVGSSCYDVVVSLLDKLDPTVRNNLIKEIEEKAKDANNTYFYITEFGEVKSAMWQRSRNDYTRHAFGNYFKTQEDALKENKHRMIYAQLKELAQKAGEPDNAWDGKNKHWRVYYNVSRKNMDATFDLTEQQGMVYFPSKREALEAVQEVGADNYLKYILRR